MKSLKNIILNAGISNVMFLIPMRPIHTIFFISYTSGEDKTILVPAVIDESRYKVKEGYKITLKSIYESFGSESFYQSDLKKIIEDGHVQMFVNVKLT